MEKVELVEDADDCSISPKCYCGVSVVPHNASVVNLLLAVESILDLLQFFVHSSLLFCFTLQMYGKKMDYPNISVSFFSKKMRLSITSRTGAQKNM